MIFYQKILQLEATRADHQLVHKRHIYLLRQITFTELSSYFKIQVMKNSSLETKVHHFICNKNEQNTFMKSHDFENIP